MYFLGIEEAVPNLLIQTGTREVSYHDIIVYGNTLVKRMQERGYSATIGYSKEGTNSFLKQYDKYFIETEDGLSMTPDITHNDLIQAFRGHLPLPILYAILET